MGGGDVLPFLGEKGKQNSLEISGKGRDSPGTIPLVCCFFFFSGPRSALQSNLFLTTLNPKAGLGLQR